MGQREARRHPVRADTTTGDDGAPEMIMTSGDDRLAADLADRAGRLLIELRSRGGEPSALRHAGDRSSHEFLTAELARLRPGDAVLSEEGADDRTRLLAGRVWIVDPLDGTREFGEAGRSDWAVHVALWEKGGLTAGAVALPAQDAVLATGGLSTGRPEAGTVRPGDPTSGTLRIVVSRTRPPELAQRLAARTGAQLVPLGSAGAKAAEVIQGRADAYVHSGGQYEWDSAAPVAVALAAGLHASRIDGSALAYNQDPPSVPDILICRAELASMLLEAIRSVRG
jgi:3'(2'), 5'-bisphosphate nucleotidase